MMKTKAAILFRINSPLVIDEIEIPQLKKGQVLVKMQSAGICRSQLNEIKGWKGEDKYLPHLLGHEGAATVIEIGPGISKVKRNDFVVLSWIKGEGLEGGPVEYRCRNTIINAGSVAVFSEYAVISENRLFRISDEKISADIACLLGCAVSTGAGIVFNTLKLKKGSTIAIFGVGGIGASSLLAASASCCRKIVAVDISDEKLAFGRSLGATDTINAKTENVKARLRLLIPQGTDYAIEASGDRSAMESAFTIIKDKGIAVIAGNLKENELISINPFDLIKGKKIIGSWGGEAKLDKDIPFYLKLYQSGELKLDKLIGDKFKLEDINKAFDILAANKALGRMIIDYNNN